MKTLKSLFILSLFCLPISLVAQASIVGDWLMPVPTEDGSMVTMKISINADHTYSLDFGGDGVVEVTGTYKVDGNKMMIKDNSGSDCTGEGVYTIEVTAKTCTMTRVSDPCPNRGGPEGKLVMNRA